jgi:hypothetical protein
LHAEIKAVTGHTTGKDVTRSIRAAEQKKLADRAIASLGTKTEQLLANRKYPLANRA